MTVKCPNCEISLKVTKADPSVMSCGICGYERAVATQLLKQMREVDDVAKSDLRFVSYTELAMPKWKKVLSLIGIPVEEEYYSSATFPFVSVSFVIAIVAVQLLGRGSVDTLAFEPNNPWKYGGLGLLTYSLAHQNLLHMAGNLIFAWPFFDNVEEHLGHRKTIALFVFSSVVAALAHWCVSSAPLVGASGVFLAFATLYCLLYPKNRFIVAPPIGGMLMFRYRLRVRARTLLFWYLGLDILFGLVDLYSPSSTSHAAHVGGALAGFLFWLAFKDEYSKA